MSPSLDVRRLILVPALITLGVTLLRLAGEVMHWSPAFFSREAGGAGAVVGIVWLVPVFAIYFALRLLRAGPRPALGRAALFGFAGLAVFALAVVAITKAGLGPVASIAVLPSPRSWPWPWPTGDGRSWDACWWPTGWPRASRWPSSC